MLFGFYVQAVMNLLPHGYNKGKWRSVALKALLSCYIFHPVTANCACDFVGHINVHSCTPALYIIYNTALTVKQAHSLGN